MVGHDGGYVRILPFRLTATDDAIFDQYTNVVRDESDKEMIGFLSDVDDWLEGGWVIAEDRSRVFRVFISTMNITAPLLPQILESHERYFCRLTLTAPGGP